MTTRKIALVFLSATAAVAYFAVSAGSQKPVQEVIEAHEIPSTIYAEDLSGQIVERELVLDPPAAIAPFSNKHASSDSHLGLLLDADNSPVRGWKLELQSRDKPSKVSSVSNIQGAFSLPELLPPWECVIEDPEGTIVFQAQVEAEDLNGESLVLRLPLMSTLTLKVLDSSGAPIKAATVTLKGTSDVLSAENLGVLNLLEGLSGRARTVVTDEGGMAVARNLTRHYLIAVGAAKGFESKAFSFSMGQKELTVQLDPAPTISFLVIAEESGEPIVGAEIWGKKSRRFRARPSTVKSSTWSSSRSDSHGVARIAVKGRGDMFTVVCRARGMALLGISFLLSEAPKGITLTLSQAKSLVVSLIDDMGSPVPGVSVTLIEEASIEEGRIPIQGLLDMFKSQPSITDSQGNATFSQVPQIGFRVEAKNVLESLHQVPNPEQLLASGYGFPGEEPVVLTIGNIVVGFNTLSLLLHSDSGETVPSDGLVIQLSSKSVSGPWFRSEMNAIPSLSDAVPVILGVPFEPTGVCIRSADYFFSNLSLSRLTDSEFQLEATAHVAQPFKLNISDFEGSPFANKEVVFRLPAVEGLGGAPLRLNGKNVFQTDKNGILNTPPLPNGRFRVESRWDSEIHAFLELSNELGAVVEVVMQK